MQGTMKTRRLLALALAALAAAAVAQAADGLTAYSMVTRDGRRLVSRSENGETASTAPTTSSARGRSAGWSSPRS